MSPVVSVKKTKGCLEHCSPKDYEHLLDFLDLTFRKDSYHWFSTFMTHIFTTEPGSIACHLIRKELGKIVAAIGIYPLELVIGNVSLRVGGIGSVSVHPSERGGGMMSSMLSEVKQKLTGEGYELSWLGGDRFRYRNYGWDLGGCVAEMTIFTRDLVRYYPKIVPVKKLDVTEAAVPDLLRLHSRFYARIARNEAVMRLHLRRLCFRWKAVTGNGRMAYLICDTNRPSCILELQGDPETVVALLKQHMEVEKTGSVTVMYPPIPGDPVFDLLVSVAGTFSLRHSSQFQVIDTGAVWQKMTPAIAGMHQGGAAEGARLLEAVCSDTDRRLLLQRVFAFFENTPVLPKHLDKYSFIHRVPCWVPQLDGI